MKDFRLVLRASTPILIVGMIVIALLFPRSYYATIINVLIGATLGINWTYRTKEKIDG